MSSPDMIRNHFDDYYYPLSMSFKTLLLGCLLDKDPKNT